MNENSVSGKEIIWHPRQQYTRNQYRAALDDVFDSLWFDNARMRFNLIGSYRMCLKPMVQYAVDNDIDEIDFIHGIRDILLEMPGCSLMTR